MSNVYGVAHFAKQNAVPQVEWKNIDIIGDFIKNQMAKKQLEMMDKNYELAKDQAAFAREKFGYDQERDKVKDGQWQKEFDYKVIEADKNRKHDFDLEKVKNGYALGQIAAKKNALLETENRAKKENFKLFMAEKENAEKRLMEQEKLLNTMDPTTNEYARIAKSFNNDYINFESTFFLPYGGNYDETGLEMAYLLWLKKQVNPGVGSNNGLGI